jgi:ABC-type methionine transport system permease subunit
MELSPLVSEGIGILGMSLLLLGFTLNVMKKVTPESDSYLVLNILASILLLLYAAILRSIPFVILNVFWGSVSLVKLFKTFFEVNSSGTRHVSARK